MPDAPDWLVVGKVIAAFGTKGELRVMPQTDFPEQRFQPGMVLHAERFDLPLTIESVRWHKGQPLLTFREIPDRDTAEELRGRYLRVPGDALASLDEGEYYLFQIVGLLVCDEQGHEFGKIREVLQTGANDVYVVPLEPGELLVPATKEVVLDVNLAEGKMLIRPLPGMLPADSEGTS
ncbi:MAG: ribosome maturation factor RimM [Chloroflexi bacterium]|nr:ribosome maturation factor RimM [Chloroflexota bacterium]